jgi:hypothetical protein
VLLIEWRVRTLATLITAGSPQGVQTGVGCATPVPESKAAEPW